MLGRHSSRLTLVAIDTMQLLTSFPQSYLKVTLFLPYFKFWFDILIKYITCIITLNLLKKLIQVTHAAHLGQYLDIRLVLINQKPSKLVLHNITEQRNLCHRLYHRTENLIDWLLSICCLRGLYLMMKNSKNVSLFQRNYDLKMNMMKIPRQIFVIRIR